MEKKDLLIVFLIGVLVVAIGALVANIMPAQSNYFTGRQTELDTNSTVNIQNYIAVSLSDDLASGIDFGTVNALPVTKQNATENNLTSTAPGYYIELSSDSNYNATICLNGSIMTNPNSDTIPLGNYFWNDSLTGDGSNPGLPGTNLTSEMKNGTPTMAPSAKNYYRFWLNISGNQNPGVYNNTVYFKAARSGQDACGNITK